MPQAESRVQCDYTQVLSTDSDRSNESDPFQKNVYDVVYDRDDVM